MNTITDGFFVRVSRKFGRFSVSHLIVFFQNVIEMVPNNPAFANPLPTIAAMTAAVEDLMAKAAAAMNRGRLEVAARRASKVVLLTLGRQLANFVEAHCNGDLQTLLSSGFEAIKAPTPKVVPATPGDPRLDYNGLSGKLVFRFTGESNVRNFSVQYSENPDGPWTDHGLSTSTRVKLEDLTPGKTYWARSRANGSAGSSDWTVPTSKMAV